MAVTSKLPSNHTLARQFAVLEERMKHSGMRWSKEGGQAILTFRALDQSGRFDAPWECLMDHRKGQLEANDRPCEK